MPANPPEPAGPWPGDPKWPGELGSALLDWTFALRVAVEESDDPKVQRLIAAALNLKPVEFIYAGGTAPGERRRFTPTQVFRVCGYDGLYVGGYCHNRKQERVFRVERMELL